MSIRYHGRRRSTAFDSFAGGEAGLGEIARAAWDVMLYVNQANSAHIALERAYDDRIEEVRRMTGQTRPNPLREIVDERREADRRFTAPSIDELEADPTGERRWEMAAERRMREFQQWLDKAAGQIPDRFASEHLMRSVEGEAIRIAREADERLATFMDSRAGLGKWGALLAGGMAAAFSDPVMVASLALGGGPGTARTAAARILQVAGREALINAAAETAMQPNVQAWREKAGLDHGLEQAIRNVAFAGMVGGAFGGVFGGLGELGRLRGEALERAADAARAEPKIDETVRRTLEGDIAAARESLPEIREALPAEARGALDAAERIDHFERTRPRSSSIDHHDATLARAERLAADPAPAREEGLVFEPDPVQVERVADLLAPRVQEEGQRALSLIDFLIARGGVIDDGGELAHIGAAAVAKPFRGRLVRESGSRLDAAREAAEEAGYIGRAGEYQSSSIGDLVDAIDAELRGAPTYPRGQEPGTARAGEAERAHAEDLVDRILRAGGPGLDDDLVAAAARLAADEGIDPLDALERILTRAELDGSSPARAGRDGEPLPGWTDEELLAAAERRGATAEPDGIDDPGPAGLARIADEDDLLLSARDVAEFGDEMIPLDDGTLVPLSRYADELAREEHLIDVIRSCRL